MFRMERRGQQAGRATRQRQVQASAAAGTSLSSSSAICTALVAAPLRRLSLTHQKSRALGRCRSWRIRPTKTSSVPAASAARG